MRANTHKLIQNFNARLANAEIALHPRWDAYYDKRTMEWLEPACSDPACDYCKDRPEKATAP